MQEYEQLRDHLIDMLEDLDGQLDITRGEKNNGEHVANQSVEGPVVAKNNVDSKTVAHEEVIKLWQAIGKSDKNK